MPEKKQIQIGALLSYLSIALNIVAGLIYTPWMIEKIGQSDYGLYTLSNSLITLFLVDFGLGSATSRYIAKYRAEGNQEKIDNFLGAIYKLYLIIDGIIFTALIIVFFIIDDIYVKLTYDELTMFKVVYVVSALFAVVNFPFITFNGILTAFEQFIQLKVADIVYRVLLVVLTVAALLAGFGLYALVTVHAGVGLVTTCLKFVIIKKWIPIRPNLKFHNKALYKEIFKFSLWVTVASLAQRLIFNITPSILGAMANTAEIAVFGIVTVIEGYSYTITSAINGMFLPQISRIYQGGEAQRNITQLLLGVGRFQYALNGLIIAGFVVVGRSFISVWMGREYMNAYIGLILVMIPGLYFNSLEIANTALVVQNKVNLQAYVNVGAGIVNVLLSFPLSAHYGAVGACMSIFVAYMVRAVVLNWIYWRVLKIDIPLVIRNCYMKMSIPIILTIMVGVLINLAVPEGGWTVLITKSLLIAFVYIGLVFSLCLDQGERMKIMRFIKKTKGN